jgi:hypothetical protein
MCDRLVRTRILLGTPYSSLGPGINTVIIMTMAIFLCMKLRRLKPSNSAFNLGADRRSDFSYIDAASGSRRGALAALVVWS